MDKKKKKKTRPQPGLGKYERETCRTAFVRSPSDRDSCFYENRALRSSLHAETTTRSGVSINRCWNRRRDFNDSGDGGGGIARTTPVVLRTQIGPSKTAGSGRVQPCSGGRAQT